MVDMISYLGRNRLVKKSEEIFTDEFKRLLETKHLYQSTTMDLYVGLGGEEDNLWRSQAAREKWGVRDNATRPTACRVPPDSEHWISESCLANMGWETAGRTRWPNRVGGRRTSAIRL